MDGSGQKCVIILDGALPVGAAANAAAILGVTLGRYLPGLVGGTVTDRDGLPHLGIVETPLPVLRGDRALLEKLRADLCTAEYAGLLAVDFSELAQGCRTYDEYVWKASAAGGAEFGYCGLAVCGDKKKVNRLTGSLPLLR